MASKHGPAKRAPLETGFAALVASIRQVHLECAAQAYRAVNINLTLRNWLIGAHIHHFELEALTVPAMVTDCLPNWPTRCVPKASATVAGDSSTAICPFIGPIRR